MSFVLLLTMVTSKECDAISLCNRMLLACKFRCILFSEEEMLEKNFS